MDSYPVRNCLAYAYAALRASDRFLEGSYRSPYEEFFAKLSEAMSPQKKLDFSITNSEVESFYLRKVSEAGFLSTVRSRFLSKVGTDLSPLYSVTWDTCCMVPTHAGVCTKIPKLCGRQLWEVFVRLDQDSHMGLHIEDVCDLVMRIFQANGHRETEENIREWFCAETFVDFWSFFSALTENYVGLLQPAIIQEIYDTMTSEILLKGKLKKKGHRVPNWKERVFILTSSALTYYESLQLKGTININAKAQVNVMIETKGHPFRVRVVDGVTAVPTEISAPDAQMQHKWKDTLQLAITMNQVEGRNFLHKLRLAKLTLRPHTQPPALTQSVVVENPAKPVTTDAHRPLSPSRSVPLDTDGTRKPHHRKLPLPPRIAPYQQRPKSVSPLPRLGYPDDSFLNDPPPLPPQLFRDDSVIGSKRQVRLRPKKTHPSGKDLTRRHSSIMGESDVQSSNYEIEHTSRGGANYAVVKRKVSKEEPSPSNGSADSEGKTHRKLPITPKQHSLDALDKKKPPLVSPKLEREKRGYVELQFQTDKDSDLPRDVKPKFGYSKLVFQKEPPTEKDPEKAQELKRKKVPPALPPKYDGEIPKMKTHQSESHVRDTAPSSRKNISLPELTTSNGRDIDYSQIEFSNCPPAPDKPESHLDSPARRPRATSPYANLQFNGTESTNPPPPRDSAERSEGLKGKPPYENLNFDGSPLPPPRIPPHRKISSPTMKDPPPPVPARK